MTLNRSGGSVVFSSATVGMVAASLYLLLLTNQYGGDGLR
jgi:hypothetical protein